MCPMERRINNIMKINKLLLLRLFLRLMDQGQKEESQ